MGELGDVLIIKVFNGFSLENGDAPVHAVPASKKPIIWKFLMKEDVVEGNKYLKTADRSSTFTKA